VINDFGMFNAGGLRVTAGNAAISAGHLAVITTVQPPTPCVRKLAAMLRLQDVPLLIIGDSKGPYDYSVVGTELWSLEDQQTLTFELGPLLPTKHYARKNIGYLIAIQRGASCIYETDDDNAPLPVWTLRNVDVCAIELESQPWTNVYRWFSDQFVWPRGFPLELIRNDGTIPRSIANSGDKRIHAPIQQGLANNSPDVDAVWRLVFDRDFTFNHAASVSLPPGSWCPFNSQTTWWWPEAYPLLYLPSFCSFRMTDIWRAFVAQRCLWELGIGIVFHAPEVYQTRNEHSLLRDFEAEVPGYRNNARIAEHLDAVRLSQGVDNVADNMVRCYETLVKLDVFPSDEMPLVRAWQTDLIALAGAGPPGHSSSSQRHAAQSNNNLGPQNYI
jgi:hypothetical protein